MKKQLLMIPLILCSCDRFNDVIVKDGHLYIWIETRHGHFDHDPDCPKCKEAQCKAALHDQNKD